MIIKRPRQDAGWSTFIKPLDEGMWLALGVAILLGAIILSVTYQYGLKTGKKTEHHYDFSVSLFISVHSFFQQG